MSNIHFNEENDYSEWNKIENEDFHSNILQAFLFEPKQKRACNNERHDKETEHIHASAADLLRIRIGNLDWCKCWQCKRKREK